MREMSKSELLVFDQVKMRVLSMMAYMNYCCIEWFLHMKSNYLRFMRDLIIHP